MRVSATRYFLVLCCVVSLAGCGSADPVGPEEPGSHPLAPAGDPCDPLTIPC